MRLWCLFKHMLSSSLVGKHQHSISRGKKAINKQIKMADNTVKGRVCVTGGTGFLGSWIVKRLLQDGYSVNATARLDPEHKRPDISYLTSLPEAPKRLQILHADLENPDRFAPAIQGCIGVFHVAHPLDLLEKETEQDKMGRALNGLRAILRACADSKTVRRVVYTSSIGAAAFGSGIQRPGGLVDESSWTDVEMIRSFGGVGSHYIVAKTLTESTAFEFARELGLDLVTVLPSCTTGPFLCSHFPDSVQLSMALFFGDKGYGRLSRNYSFVHVDDVARAHIHLLEHPQAKGRYICSSLDITIDELREFLYARYPEYEMPSPDLWRDMLSPVELSGFCTRKLVETGFEYENGLEEMFDGAVRCCKEMGLL